MASYNRVILVGNLTRDIEIRYTPGGTAVADIAIAVNDRRKTASGEWFEEVSFVEVTMFGRTAEVASEYLAKGSPILVEGRLKQERWQSDGKNKSKLKVLCERMQMLSGGGSNNGGSNGDGRGQARASEQQKPSVSQSREQPSGGSGNSMVSEAAPSNRDAQPTGSGPGYEDPDIPF